MFEISNETSEDKSEVATAAVFTVSRERIFTLDKVQFSTQIALLTVSNNCLIIACPNNEIKLIDLTSPDSISNINTLKTINSKIFSIHTNPSAEHLVVSFKNGSNYYLNTVSKKFTLLSKFRGILIQAIAWPSSETKNIDSTGAILVASKQGHIFEADLNTNLDSIDSKLFSKKSAIERFFSQVHTIDDNGFPITAISYEMFPTDPKKCVVFVTTVHRLFQFIGHLNTSDSSVGLFGSLFSIDTLFQEIPGEIQHSQLHFWYPFVKVENEIPISPQLFAWLTGAGIFSGKVNFLIESRNTTIIEEAQLFPYPTASDKSKLMPISIAITEFHFLMLFADKIQAICRLNQEVVYEEEIFLEHGEVVLGMTVDVSKNTFWVYTQIAIYEVVVVDEDRDIWKLFLGRKSFDEANRLAKNDSQRDIVVTAQANYYFDQKDYTLAAHFYAKSRTVSFEEICLKFLDLGLEEELKIFLLKKLETLKKTDVVQSSLICTWLTEIFLNKLNESSDEIHFLYKRLKYQVDNSQETQFEIAERHKQMNEDTAILHDEFKQFLRIYHERVDKKSIFSLLNTHGDVDAKLFFAELTGDHETVISHFIQEKNWTSAIGDLCSQGSFGLYYKYSPILLGVCPKEIVDIWIKQANLNPKVLIPALMKYDTAYNDTVDNQAIRYLEFCIFNLRNNDTTVHNFLLSFYVKYAYKDQEASLLKFLNSQKDIHKFDLQYALRLCHQSNLVQSCILIYGQLEMYEQAVELSLLKLNDLELARIYADKPEDDEALLKRLWLKIARYVVEEKKDIKTTIEYLKLSQVLKIEDILPLFPDFVLINDFQEEIENTLEDYNTHIEQLKEEMNGATKAAENIRLDIRQLRNKHVSIPVTQRCQTCSLFLLTRKFYIFPCQHSFHYDCLMDQVLKECNPRLSKRILNIQNQISNELKKSQPLKPILSLTSKKTLAGSSNGALEKLEEQLNELVGAECPLCGDLLIKNVDKPFIGINDSLDVGIWAL